MLMDANLKGVTVISLLLSLSLWCPVVTKCTGDNFVS